jgi:hypothetical protein
MNFARRFNRISKDKNLFIYIDLTKLCYDFTCIHSGVCSINENDGPRCDCSETGYIGERCDKCKLRLLI